MNDQPAVDQPGGGSAVDPPPSRDVPPAGAPGPPHPPGPATGATGQPPPEPGQPPGAAPPPVTATAFATRYGLVRPLHGRYLSGVCAAIGRATNTDPVLWRVLLAVTSFFGIGVLVYLAGWLLLPAEGDTASPIEALFGRGRSRTSPVLVVVLGVLAVLLLAFIITDGFRGALLLAAVVIAGVLVLNKNSEPGPARTTGYPSGAPPAPYPSGAPPAPYPSGAPPAPYSMASPGSARAGTAADPGWEDPAFPLASAAQPVFTGQPLPTEPLPAQSFPAEPVTPAAPQPYPTSSTPIPPDLGLGTGQAPPAPSGYRPPFAPRGPYASGPPDLPYPPYPVASPPPRPPALPQQRSWLSAFTLSAVLVVLGATAVLDLANVFTIHPSGYFAAALAVVGLGLLIGAWFGRARWLVPIGVLLALALATTSTVESSDRVRSIGNNSTWRPASYAELADRYEQNFGTAELDLRGVDFTGQHAVVTVNINAGDLEVILPPTVDANVWADVNAGDAQVFGNEWGGFNAAAHEVTDLGEDGSGGGNLRLLVHINAGTVEVHR